MTEPTKTASTRKPRSRKAPTIKKPVAKAAPKTVEEKTEASNTHLSVEDIMFDSLRGHWIGSTLVKKGTKFHPVVGSVFESKSVGKIKALFGSGPKLEGRKTLSKGDMPFLNLKCKII